MRTTIFPDFSARSEQAEIMDLGSCTQDELAEAYRELERVNHFLGGSAAVLRPLRRWIRQRGLREATVLDVGAGASDIPRRLVDWGRLHGCRLRCVALDLNDEALRVSRETLVDHPEVTLVRADALRLPFPDRSFDFAIASMFFHHLGTGEAVQILQSFERLVRVGFVINDLHRHRVAYYSFWALSRLFSRNRLIRHDGPVSILRGFIPADFEQLKKLSGLGRLAIRRYFPYRLVLFGEKNHVRTLSANERECGTHVP